MTGGDRICADEKISGERSVNSGAKNIIGGIADQIGDCAEPESGIVGERCAAAIHAEIIDSRGGRIFANVGITSEHIKITACKVFYYKDI